MTKISIYATLILISIFSSCSLHEVEDELNPPVEAEYTLSDELSVNTLDASLADFTINNNNGIITEGDQVLLTNSSINAVSYHWDFGNDDTSTEAQPVYKYKRHGDYTITLTISDKFENVKEFSKDITVLCVFIGNNHPDG